MQTVREQRKRLNRRLMTSCEEQSPCSPISADRRPGAKLGTPPQQKSMLDRASVSVIELKFPTWSWRVLNHHGNRDGCLAGLSSFWFETLCGFGGLQRWCYFSHTGPAPSRGSPLPDHPLYFSSCSNHHSPPVLVRLSYGR